MGGVIWVVVFGGIDSRVLLFFLALAAAFLGAAVAWFAWALASPKSLVPFAAGELGVLIDVRSPERLKSAINAIAARSPLAAFLKCQIADETIAWPTDSSANADRAKELRESLNAHFLLRQTKQGEFRFNVLSGPSTSSKNPPIVFYAEVYDWHLSGDRTPEIAQFVVSYALYRKEFYKEAETSILSPEYQFLNGCSQLRQDKHEAAIGSLEATMKVWDRRIYPDYWGRVSNNLGLAFLRLGDLGPAVSAFDGALEVRAQNTYPKGWAMTANNLALALYQQGAHDLARTLLFRSHMTLQSNGFQREADAVMRNLQTLAVPVSSAIPAEIEHARAQIRELIGIPEGPFQRPRIRIAHRLIQATSISGDFYRILPRQDGSVGITLIDVEGHGLGASATALAIEKALFRHGFNWGMGEAREQLIAADTLVEQELSHADVAVCMNFLEVNPYTNRVRYAGAGMPAPLLFRYGQSQPETLNAVGMYVGGGYRRTRVTPDRAEAEIHDGDVVVLYTDGIPEATDARGRLFGVNGMIAAVIGAGFDSPEAIADAILRAALRHSGTDQPADDQAILVVQTGTPPFGGRVAGVPTFTGVEAESPGLAFELLNADDSGRFATGELKTALVEWSIPYLPDEVRRLEVWNAVWEAVQNAIKYGSEAGDVIRIDLKPTPQQGIEVIVTQPRRWTDWDIELGSRRSTLELTGEGGVGTLIMLRLSDGVSVTDQGRSIHLRFAQRSG